MDDRRSNSSSPYDRYSYDDYRRTSSSGTSSEHRRRLEVGPQQSYRRRSPLATESETISYGSGAEDDDDEDDNNNDDSYSWGQRRSGSGSPKSNSGHSPRNQGKGKGKERQMSGSSSSTTRMGGAQFERERTASSLLLDRRSDSNSSRGGASGSNHSQSPRHGPEEAHAGSDRRGDRKSLGSNRSRLVSGVFVRY